jgi:hypothetical protein
LDIDEGDCFSAWWLGRLLTLAPHHKMFEKEVLTKQQLRKLVCVFKSTGGETNTLSKINVIKLSRALTIAESK